MLKKKVAKRLLIGLGVLVGLFLLLLICLSPILEYWVEKNDEKWIGRQVEIGWVYANPFTGNVYISDVKFYEYKSDTVCLKVEAITGRFHLLTLLRTKEIIVSKVSLHRPVGTVIQYSQVDFSFSDIVEKFSKKPGEKKENKTGPKTRFSMPDIEIKNGTFYFRELMTPVSYFVKDVNITSTGYRWDSDTIANTFDFNSGLGSGKFEGNITLNLKTLLYRSHMIVRRLDLTVIEQYLRDLSRNAKFKALINLDITANGNMKDGRNIDAVGGVGIYDFHIGKTDSTDIASFRKFVIKIDHLNPRKQIYEIDSMSLMNPFIRYERYDHLDNVQDLFGEKGGMVKDAASSAKFNLVIMIADYIKLLTRNFFRSSYKINRVGIYNACLQYHDYTLNEKFKIALDPLTIFADSLGSNKRWARMQLQSDIKPYGKVNLNLSINPKDSSDFDLEYKLKRLNAALFNPYLLAYTSFPLDRGSVDVWGDWHVQNGDILSINHVQVLDPRIAKKVKANDNKWIPVKALMFLARGSGNVIDYDIPITGNLKKPDFHFKDVVVDALRNALVKPVTTPYRYEVKYLENSIEKSIGFNWEPGTACFMGDQESYLERVADFLSVNPGASIKVFPNYYEEKELEYIALYEGKKKYFLLSEKKNEEDFSRQDSIGVVKMSPKDSLFNLFMRRHLKDTVAPTTQQLSVAFVGSELVRKKYNALREARKQKFLSYFGKEGVADRLYFEKATSQVPYNGFSYYQLSYNGAIPESMKQAYRELQEYDGLQPRKELKRKRDKRRRFFNARGKRD
ncbi:MAG: DUF748 domain-containing protein [Bacteroidia bacterium]|nr:DUF748 domain-containing protein [Bacteroidia bacterium]